MLKNIAILSGLCLSLFSTGPVFAGWQHTEWGMSVDEVKKNLGDQNLTRKNPNAELYETPYLVNLGGGKKLDTEAVLYFSPNVKKLYAVSVLSSNRSDCTAIQTELKFTYGNPLFTDTDGTTKNEYWLDRKNNNRVSFLIIDQKKPDHCIVRYTEPKEKNQDNGM